MIIHKAINKENGLSAMIHDFAGDPRGRYFVRLRDTDADAIVSQKFFNDYDQARAEADGFVDAEKKN